MKKKVVIFGASGFIGTHLIKTLSTEGYGVVAADIKPPREKIEGIEYITSDVRDLSSLKLGGEIDLIINLAAIHTTPGHKTYEYYETNVLGATEVTAFARRHNVKTILFTSSISVYGSDEERKRESSLLAPISAYGWSKALAEKIHENWQQEIPGRRLIVCRPAVVFGHGEGGNFCRLAKLLQKGFFVYPGRKDTIKSCIYIKDLIDALLFAWKEQEEDHIIFNGCFLERYTIEDIVTMFRKNHFPKAKTILMPRLLVLFMAKMLKPFSVLGLGIHPDRVMKLLTSTDVVPDWMEAKGIAKQAPLESALEDWAKESNGTFD